MTDLIIEAILATFTGVALLVIGGAFAAMLGTNERTYAQKRCGACLHPSQSMLDTEGRCHGCPNRPARRRQGGMR